MMTSGTTPVARADDAKAAAPRGEVKQIASETAIQIEIDGKPFTTYRFAGDDKPPFVRPFFYPVLASDGVEVTSDQVRTNPKEHPHHRSIWVAHGDVNGVDHWSFQQKLTPEQLAAGIKPDAVPAKQRHVRFERVGGDTIVEQLEWDDLKGPPLFNETRTIRFIAYPDGARGIDLTIALTAANGDVTLADTKEAGLAAVRLAKQISDHATITQSTGATATGDAKNAKQEKDVWGKPAEWCDESGQIDGKPYGVAVLDHPSNFRHPTPWHVRLYGLLAPNEWGLHEFDKKANPEHAGDQKITKGQTATFRYRIVVHTGDAASAKLDEKYREYVAGR